MASKDDRKEVTCERQMRKRKTEGLDHTGWKNLESYHPHGETQQKGEDQEENWKLGRKPVLRARKAPTQHENWFPDPPRSARCLLVRCTQLAWKRNRGPMSHGGVLIRGIFLALKGTRHILEKAF